MSDISMNIRLNDYMSSTLRIINNTMQQSINIMRQLEHQLQTLGAGGIGGFHNMGASLSAIMAQVHMLQGMIASIGTGAGPGGAMFHQLNAQLIAAQSYIATLESQLASLSHGDHSPQMTQLTNNLAEAHTRITQLETELAHLNESDNGGGKLFSLGNISGGIQKVQDALGKVGQVTQIADEFTNANIRLNTINDGLRTQAELQQQVLNIANNTGTSYTATADLVMKMGRTKQFAGDNDSAIRFSDLVNKSLNISGANPEETSDVISQLSEAMSSGTLNGEQFNAVIQNGGRMVGALSTELGVNVQGLRQMAEDGKLTAEVVANAIIKQGAIIDKEFAKMPATFSKTAVALQDTIGIWLAESAIAGGALARLNDIFKDFVLWLRSEDGHSFLDTIGLSIGIVMLLLSSLIDVSQTVLPGVNEVFAAIGWTIETVITIIANLANTVFGVLPMIAGVVSIAAGVFFILYGQTLLSAAATAIYTAMTQGAAIATQIWTTAVTILRTGFTMLRVAMLANPIGFIITLIMAAIAVFAALEIKTKGLRQVFSDVFGFIVDTVGKAVNFVIQAFNGVIQSFNRAGEFFGKVLGFEYKEIKEVDLELDTEAFKNVGQDIIQNASLDNVKDKLRPNSEDLDDPVNWRYPSSDNYNIPMADGVQTPVDINSVNNVNKVGKIDDDVNIADEDLKMLMELAIQNRVNQINLSVQTSAPNVTQNNIVNNELDVQTVTNQITTAIYNAKQVMVEQDYQT